MVLKGCERKSLGKVWGYAGKQGTLRCGNFPFIHFKINHLAPVQLVMLKGEDLLSPKLCLPGAEQQLKVPGAQFHPSVDLKGFSHTQPMC